MSTAAFLPNGVPDGALAGLRVLDLSRVLGGPYCTQVLADHGADVLKVEPPAGDETRSWGPPFRNGTASYYLGLNRNKRNIALDLSTPAGREALLTLVEDADVLIENFKSGTMERWGIGPTELRERFPRLVYCRVAGFGDDGPFAGFPAYDTAIQAMIGLMSLNGHPEGGPCRVGFPVVDLVTGLNAALGVMFALQERARSGEGQYVETALYDCGMSLLHPYASNYFVSGKAPQRAGNAHSNIYPYDVFETRTNSVYVAVGNDRQFALLANYLERVEIARDERFATNGDRSVHRVELRTVLADLFRDRDGSATAVELMRAGVPCGEILDVVEVLEHPQTAAREMIVRIGDDYTGLASPIRLDRTPATYRLAPSQRPAVESTTSRFSEE